MSALRPTTVAMRKAREFGGRHVDRLVREPWSRQNVQAADVARWAPLPHEVQVELLCAGTDLAEAVCSNPALTPAAVIEAIARASSEVTARLAEAVVWSRHFDELPAGELAHLAALVDFRSGIGRSAAQFALVLARRPDVTDAVLADPLPSLAWVAAMCQLRIDWHSDQVASVEASLPRTARLPFAMATQGRRVNQLWKGPSLLPQLDRLPSQFTDPDECGSLARLLAEGVARPRLGARPLLMAAGLLSNPVTPPDAAALLADLCRRPSSAMRRLIDPRQQGDDLAGLVPQRAREVAAVFEGADAETLRVAVALSAGGFAGSARDLVDAASRVR